eukprot:TRINITY_DN6516_c0_g1_i1.p1 TRINITY_DN6516_c0_g1~~TRINITY_DN6516_c0_g1_i1.p1  ORF type:complete len:79 (+),score=7.02 TRINITY_DN6516_c0_g1_i1:81-317(+)
MRQSHCNQNCEKTEKRIDPKESIPQKVLSYNRANREVAILCNHQRSVPKAFAGQMEKLSQKIVGFKQTKEILQMHMKI